MWKRRPYAPRCVTALPAWDGHGESGTKCVGILWTSWIKPWNPMDFRCFCLIIILLPNITHCITLPLWSILLASFHSLCDATQKCPPLGVWEILGTFCKPKRSISWTQMGIVRFKVIYHLTHQKTFYGSVWKWQIPPKLYFEIKREHKYKATKFNGYHLFTRTQTIIFLRTTIWWWYPRFPESFSTLGLLSQPICLRKTSFRKCCKCVLPADCGPNHGPHLENLGNTATNGCCLFLRNRHCSL